MFVYFFNLSLTLGYKECWYNVSFNDLSLVSRTVDEYLSRAGDKMTNII